MQTYTPSIGVGTIYARGKRGTYYFEDKSAGIKASLKTSDPHEAERQARKCYGYLLAGDRVEKLTEATARLAVAKDDERSARRQPVPLELSAVWSLYADQLALVSVARKHADATRATPLSLRHLRQQKSSLSKFLAWYKDHGTATQMHQVSTAEAERFLAGVLRGGASLSSFNRYLCDLSVIWKRCGNAIASGNPFGTISQRKRSEVEEDTAHKQPFTDAELDTIHEKATGWLAVAVTIGEETALRLGDVVTLKTSNLDGDYIVKQTRKGRKKQALYAPLSVEAIVDYLAGHPTASEYVFENQAQRYLGFGGFKRNDSAAVKEFMHFITSVCAITVTDATGKTVKGFHSLRVNSATATATAIGSGSAQRLLGHGDGRTTAPYVSESIDSLKAKAKAGYVGSTIDIAKQAFTRLSEADREAFRAWLATGP
jgi:integrase